LHEHPSRPPRQCRASKKTSRKAGKMNKYTSTTASHISFDTHEPWPISAVHGWSYETVPGSGEPYGPCKSSFSSTARLSSSIPLPSLQPRITFSAQQMRTVSRCLPFLPRSAVPRPHAYIPLHDFGLQWLMSAELTSTSLPSPSSPHLPSSRSVWPLKPSTS